MRFGAARSLANSQRDVVTLPTKERDRPAALEVSSSRLGGPSSRIFLDAAREIAGVLEELVEREAEREQPLDLGGRKRARQAFASQRRDFGVAGLERGVERLERWRSVPVGEFIGTGERELASPAAETRKRRGKTLSDGAGKRLGGGTS